MRYATEEVREGYMIRWWDSRHSERAYVIVGWRTLAANVEFPSEWHERALAWVHLCFGFISINFSFPWRTLAPDHGQCSGPRYGFYFFDRQFVWCWGQDTGRSRDPKKRWHFDMPWMWRHRTRIPLAGPESYPYTYVRRGGEVQHRTATVTSEAHVMTRPWLPWKRRTESIWVSFDGEVGEGAGSWKGGTTGCGYDMLPGETPLACLRRMERERKFER